ncbi:hypothetical protein CAL12_23880 [Bordetella genomosp. 8]|uniref:PEGA domain-containing protein n=1 Tax=Bordetella genomosp. 8 TaxID=1416806 RepID=A0A1W6YR72_9BORD|nr:hypothetical protein [Bordetella genomosp. 8]ARP83547.1 hypothetical protein CAL12_23880 [Bordetella genomosp. 8]
MPNVPACPPQDDDDAPRNEQGNAPSRQLVPASEPPNTAPVVAPPPLIYAYIRPRLRRRPSGSHRASSGRKHQPLAWPATSVWKLAVMATIGVGALIAWLDPQTAPGGPGAALASRHGPGADAINGSGALGTSSHASSRARSYAGDSPSLPERSAWADAPDASPAGWTDAAARARPIPMAAYSDPLAVANASLDAAAPGHTVDATADAPTRRPATIIDVVTADMTVDVTAPDARAPSLPAAAPVRGPVQTAKADAPGRAPATTRAVAQAATKTPANAPANTATRTSAKSPAKDASPKTQPLPTAQAKSRSPVSVPIAVRPWGEILVDGESRGISPPMRRLTLAAGTYDITIRNNVGPDVHQRLTVGAGQGAAISHTFQ